MKKFFIVTFLWACIFLNGLGAQKAGNSRPAVFIQETKMNVMYVGVDNPVDITCKGISEDSVEIQISGGTIKHWSRNHYSVFLDTVGEVRITALIDGKPLISYIYRGKPIPDPIPALGGKYTRSDTIQTGVFKSLKGISAILPKFDWDVKCEIVEYKITYIGADYEKGKMFTHVVKNIGPFFSPEAQELINEATPDEIFIFSEIKARCPGDVNLRNLNALVFFMESIGND